MLTSSTGSYGPSGAPFCGSLENDQWLGFIAGCTSATFTVTPSNCTTGNGCQIALYDQCGGPFLACNVGSMGAGGVAQSITYNNMVIGSNYFLLIDGWAGDVCDFQIVVSPPSCVSAPPVAPSGAMTGPATICPNGTGVYCLPNVAGAGGYVWTIPADASINGEQGPGPITLDAPTGRCATIVFGPSTGPKQVCVRPANSCFQGTQVCKAVNVQPIPLKILPPITLCNEEAANYDLPWSGSISTTPGTTPYQTSITTATGCDSMVRIVITVKPPLLTNLPAKVICQGTCVTVGGEQFCDPGQQSVTVTTYQGCDSIINFNLTVLEPVAEIIGSGNITCSNTSVTLNSAPPINGSPVKIWKNLAGQTVGTGATVTVTAPGTYILNVTLSQGGVMCSKTDTIVIGGNITAPSLTASGGVIGCTNTSVALSAVTNAPPTPTWNWTGPNSFSSNQQNPTVAAQGTYNVTVTNTANGCTAVATATVSGNTTAPSITTTGGTVNCTINQVTITASSSAPMSGFSWAGPGGFTSTLPNPVANTAGTYNITVTNTTNGCTSTANAVVNSDITPPNAGASVSGNIGCNNLNVTLNGNSTTSGVSYAWGGPVGFTSNLQSPTTGNLGTYIVTVTGINTCTTTASVTVNGSLAPPDASANGNTLTCTATQVQLNGNSGTANVSYSWTGPGGFSSTLEDPFVSNPGNYVLVVTNPINGCTANANANVNTDLAQPNAAATGGIIDCASGQVVAMGSTSTSGSTVAWSGPGNFTATTNNTTVTQAGTYIFTVTAPNGCTNTANAIVTLDSGVPNSFANGGTIDCTNSSVNIMGGTLTAGATFSWTGPGGFTSTAGSAIVTLAGNYVLTASAPNGCSSVATAFVIQDLVQPGASAQGGQVTCTTPNFQISASTPTGNVSYAWTGPNSFTSTNQNPIVSDPGNYLVTITGQNGCTSTATAVLTADVNTPVAVATGGTLTCTAVAITLQGQVNIAGSGFSWSGPNNFSSIDQNPVVNTPGIYTLVVNSPNGCVDQTTVDVPADVAAPNATAVGDTLTCAQTSVLLNGNSTTTNATFAWSGPNSFTASISDPSASFAGGYILTVTGANGCTATASATVNEDKILPDFNISGGELTCSNDTIALGSMVLTANAVLNWTGPNGFTATVAAPLISQKGTYMLKVTGPNGCSDQKTVVVSEDITLPNVTASGGTLTCLITEIPIDGSSTTVGATFAWTGPNNFTSTLSDPLINKDGVYILMVTGPNGCTDTKSATVTLNGNFPDITAVAGNVLDCNKPTTVLNATSSITAGTYEWTGPGNFASFDQDPMIDKAGNYIVTVTNPANGCASNFAVLVTENFNTPQNVQADGGTIDCISGNFTLQGSTTSAGAAYKWTGPLGFNSTQQNPVVTNDGEYQLLVTLANGCTNQDTASIFKNLSAPIVDITSDVTLLTCSDDTIQVTGSTTTPNTTTVWTLPNGSTANTAVILVTAPGLYEFTVESTTNGCVTTSGITIAQNINPPGATATGATISCTSPSVAIEAISPTSGVTYLWSGPNNYVAVIKKPQATVAGSYSVTVTNLGTGCTSLASCTVLSNVVPPANVTTTTNIITCLDASPAIMANSSTANCLYDWTGPNLFADAGKSINVQDPGNYVVVVKNPLNGCTTSDTVAVTQNIAQPGATAVSSNIITCTTPTSTLTANSPTASVTYNWAGPSITNANKTLQKPVVSAPGQYKVTITGTVNGCTSTATITVNTDGSIPVANVTGTVITCTNPIAQLTAVADGPVKWKWSGVGINSTNDTIPNPTVTIQGNYSVVATSPNGCTSGVVSYQITTDILPPVVSIAPPNEITCTDTIITINATASPSGVTFGWNTTSGNIISLLNTQQIMVNSVGEYALLVTNPANGCSTTVSTEVTANAAVPSGVVINDVNVRCFGETNGFAAIDSVKGGTPPYLYSFNGGAFTAATNFTNLIAGNYTVEVEDAFGCRFTEPFDIAEPSQIVVNLGADTVLILGDIITIDLTNIVNIPASQIAQMQWSGSFLGCDTCTDFTIKPLNSQVLVLTVIDTNGCRAQDVRLIEVDKQRNIFVPNAFAPDSDINNLFTIYGGQDVDKIEHFQIYDRWGENVHAKKDFDAGDPNSGWDGVWRGEKSPQAVYVWWARIRFIDGVVKTYKGDVTLSR